MVLFEWKFANEIIRQFKLYGTLLNEILQKFFPFVCSDHVCRPMLPLGRLTVNVDHKTIYTWIKARKGKCNIKTQGEIQPWLFKPEINETYQFYYKSCISIWKETHDKAKKMSRDTKEPTNFLYFFTDMIVFDSSWNKKKCFQIHRLLATVAQQYLWEKCTL